MKKKALIEAIQGSKENFKKLAKVETIPNTRVRLLGLQMLKEGATFTAVASVLNVVYTTVKEWALRFINNGLNGLRDLPGRGKKQFFPMEHKDALALEIEKMQQQKKGGRVTGKEIKLLLEKKYNAHYGLGGTYKLLDKCKIVWITGRSKHPKSNLEEQEIFKKEFKKKFKTVCHPG